MIVAKSSQVYQQAMSGYGDMISVRPPRRPPMPLSSIPGYRGYRGFRDAPLMADPVLVSPDGYPVATTVSLDTTSGTPSTDVGTPVTQITSVASPIYAPQNTMVADWTIPTDEPWYTVFDPDFYRQTRPDEFVGWSAQQLFDFFTTVGVRRGDCAIFNWCVQDYVRNYPDLQNAFNDPNWWNGDYSLALKHWFDQGIAQGRVGQLPGMCPEGMYNDGHGGCKVTPPTEPLIPLPTGTAVLIPPPDVVAAHEAAVPTASSVPLIPIAVDPGVGAPSSITPIVSSAPVQTIVDPGTGTGTGPAMIAVPQSPKSISPTLLIVGGIAAAVLLLKR